MKVVQLNTTYGDCDSTGRNVKELHEYFKRNGIESLVYVNQLNKKENEPIVDVRFFSSKADMKIHALLSRLTGLQGYYSHFSTYKLVRELKKEKPDVVILNVLHSNSVHFASLFRYIGRNRVAAVFVLHDCFFYTGHCCHYYDDKCYRWKVKCGKCPAKKKYNVSWFFDTSQKVLQDKKKWYQGIKKRGVVAVSNWIKKDAEQSILRGSDLVTIYNWVDFRVFNPQKSKPPFLEKIESPCIAFAAASVWCDEKGLYDLYEVARAFPKLTIVVAGRLSDVPDDIKNIRSIGTINNVEEMAAFYANADLFLNLSKRETFGKTTAESLACGTPVVVYDTTACRELIDETRGEVAELGNVRDYILKVRIVLERGKAYYSDCAIKFAKENFNKERNMRKYLDFIRTVAADTKNSSR